MKLLVTIALLTVTACGSAPQPDNIVIGFVLKPRLSGWYVEHNKAHVPSVDIKSVETLSDRIEVRFDSGMSNVATFLAATDETLAEQGFYVGASGGWGIIRVYLHKDTVPGFYDPHLITDPQANINIIIEGQRSANNPR